MILFLLLLFVAFIVANVSIRRFSHTKDSPSEDTDGDGGEV